MRVLVVAGARPNFMKVAPILRALEFGGHEAVLVHTGQHYDARMSETFFADLGLPEPDHHLGVGSGSHAVQTARVMEALRSVLLEERADWRVVVGDVNSTSPAPWRLQAEGEDGDPHCPHLEGGPPERRLAHARLGERDTHRPPLGSYPHPQPGRARDPGGGALMKLGEVEPSAGRADHKCS